MYTYVHHIYTHAHPQTTSFSSVSFKNHDKEFSYAQIGEYYEKLQKVDRVDFADGQEALCGPVGQERGKLKAGTQVTPASTRSSGCL